MNPIVIERPRTGALISIVVPFYNESDGIDQFHKHLTRILDGIPEHTFEVVCIDDGSQDDTLAQLVDLSELDPRIQVVELSRNFGKEAALTAGIDAACGEAVIPIDADLQDPPEIIPLLIEQWHKGAEVVLAKRNDRQADTFLKRKTAEWFYWLHNSISQVKIPSDVGDFRLMDRVVVNALKTLPERQRFMKGLFAWVGFRSVVIEYARPPRTRGETKFSFWRLWNFAIDGLTSFSTAPLRIWVYFGALGAIAAFFYILFIVLRTLLFGIDVPGYASLLSVMLFFSSIQLISIGLLGEYIGRIYAETKQRPVYVVRGRYGRHPDAA